jgi:CBS-domain-containing membrane protein
LKLDASKRDPFWTVDANESVGWLLNNFLKAGIHRVPVVDNGKVVGIVSQSDVVKLLARNMDKLGDMVS